MRDVSTRFLPDRVFWKDSVKEVILPTLTGQMGVLKNHIPLLTGLDTGLILIKKQDDWMPVVVTGGFALINANKLTVLVNEAELVSDIDSSEAEASFLSSKAALEAVTDNKKKIELLSQFKKARARVLALERIKG